MENIARIATTRHTCKAFDPAKKIDASKLDALCTVLRFAPSSVNSQPWHFVIAASDEGKGLIAQATQGGFAYNEPKVRNASHVVVLCARTDLDEKQVYLALGALLQGAGALEIDACPMEGFDQVKLDEVLGLSEQGLTSVVLVALGYRSELDFNAKLPKSRLPVEALITLI